MAPWLRRKNVLLSATLALGATEAEAEDRDYRTANAPDRSMATFVPGITAATTIDEVLAHSAFDGFDRRLLPWADRPYDGAMPLSQISALLPYHSNVLPDEVARALDRLAVDRAQGLPVFHEIYSEAEQAADPSLAEAGLAFTPGRPGAPFAIIAPGGGFAYVGAVHEGYPYALDIAAAGYNAFVLTYRAGRGADVATRDLARAIDYVMARAEALQVSRDGYALWGSSAGARMAARIGTDGPTAYGGSTTARPVAVITAYTAHQDLGPEDPPTYIVVGAEDGIAPAGAMAQRADRLRAQGTMTKMDVIPGMGHGFGTGRGTTAEGWVQRAIAFWLEQRRDP